MTAMQYDRLMRKLEQAGQEAPAGRLYHLASPSEQGWLVVDVWESADQLNGFAQTLMPLLVSVGVQPPQPKVLQTHNIVAR